MYVVLELSGTTSDQIKNSSALDLKDWLGLDIAWFPEAICLPCGQVQPYNTTYLKTRPTAILSATH